MCIINTILAAVGVSARGNAGVACGQHGGNGGFRRAEVILDPPFIRPHRYRPASSGIAVPVGCDSAASVVVRQGRYSRRPPDIPTRLGGGWVLSPPLSLARCRYWGQ